MSEPLIGPDLLLDVGLRLHAELGRARMPLAAATGLADGAIVDLDREADDPVDVYVNGRAFARGRLVVEDGEWCVRIEEILDDPPFRATVAPAGVGHASTGPSDAAPAGD